MAGEVLQKGFKNFLGKYILKTNDYKLYRIDENNSEKGNDVFGLREKDVKETLKETKLELASIRKQLDGDLLHEQRESLIDRYREFRGQEMVLSVPPKEVLKKVKTFKAAYKYIIGAEFQPGTKIKDNIFFDLLLSQHPNVASYYPLFSREPTLGGRLEFGQKVFNARQRLIERNTPAGR